MLVVCCNGSVLKVHRLGITTGFRTAFVSSAERMGRRSRTPEGGTNSLWGPRLRPWWRALRRASSSRAPSLRMRYGFGRPEGQRDDPIRGSTGL